jgi:proline iminopeptidase
MQISGRRSLFPEIHPFRSDMLAVSDPHRIYFEECGNPQGKPVLMVHGGPGGGCNPTMRRFHDPARYRIILFDQRGCGRSTPHAGSSAAAPGVRPWRSLIPRRTPSASAN